MAKQQNKINYKYDRIIVLIDMDCFYCQVEEKLNPELQGKPIAVVQYNAWKGGGIIAVNYPARDRSVTRHMRGDEAKKHCPEIELVRVPNIREKADLSKYRDAGKEVASVLQTFTTLLERASVDEAYLDITEKVLAKLKDMNDGTYVLEPNNLSNTFAVGYERIGDFVENMSARLLNTNSSSDAVLYNKNDIKLLIGASIVNEIRDAVKAQTGYECSAGIAHNKILAKLVCGLNKPNKQTILPLRHLDTLYSTLPIKKIKGLGGKFGDDVCETLQIKLMSELDRFSQEELQRQFDEKNGLWLHMISKGIDLEPVTPRFASKSIGCCKKFPGRTSIKGIATLNHWLEELANEIFERLEKDEMENNRRATQMVVSFMQEINNNDISSSRTSALNVIEVNRMAQDALDVIRKNTQTFFKADAPTVLNNPIKFLGLNVGKFEDLQSGKKNTIEDMFRNQAKKVEQATEMDMAKTETKPDIDKNSKNSFFGTKTNGPKNEEAKDEKKKSTIQSMFNHQIKKNISTTIKNDESKISSNDSSNESPTDTEQKVSEEKDIYDKSTSLEASTSSLSKETLEDDFVDDEIIESSQPTSSTPLRESKRNNIFAEIQKPQKINEVIESPHPTTSKSVLGINENKPEDHDNGISATENYKQTYAEYYLQPTSPLIQYKVCPQCNKKIVLHEMQVHSDSHFAFKLSQQQRIEYRHDVLKNKSPAPQPPVPKKQKLNGTKHESEPIGKIKEFFSKQTQSLEAEETPNEEVNEEKEKCKECGKMILLANLQLHFDYHVAKKLSQELNRIQQSSIVNKSNTLKRSTKGKSSTTKNISNDNKSIKNITSFFTQKN